MKPLKFKRTVTPGSTTYTLTRGTARAEVVNFPGTRTIMAEVVDTRPAPGFEKGLALWSDNFLKPDYTVAQVKDETLRMFASLAPKLGLAT